MKAKLQKIGLSLVVSATIAAATGYVAAQEVIDKFVQDPYGRPVRDSQGKCVLSIGGERLAGCIAEVVPPPPPKPIHEEIRLGADTFFDFNRYNLKPAGMAKLDELASKLQRPDLQLNSMLVVGNTDSVGSWSFNKALSERRAQTVKDYLVSKGINPNLIQTRGDSFDNPIASNAIPAGRAQNRRVDVTIDAMQQP